MKPKLILPLLLSLLLVTSCSSNARQDPGYWEVLAETAEGTKLAWDGVDYYVVQRTGKRERILPESAKLVLGPIGFSYASQMTGSIDPLARLDQLLLTLDVIRSLGFNQEWHGDSADAPSSVWWGGPSTERYLQVLRAGPPDSQAPWATIYIWRYSDETTAKQYFDSISYNRSYEITGAVGPHSAKAFISRLGIGDLYWVDGIHVLSIRGNRITPALVEAVYRSSVSVNVK